MLVNMIKSPFWTVIFDPILLNIFFPIICIRQEGVAAIVSAFHFEFEDNRVARWSTVTLAMYSFVEYFCAKYFCAKYFCAKYFEISLVWWEGV